MLPKITNQLPDDLKPYLEEVRLRFLGGMQAVFEFDNGYGASVILGSGTFGLELAVLYDGALDHSTPLTDDVIGHLDIQTLISTLYQIQALPAKHNLIDG